MNTEQWSKISAGLLAVALVFSIINFFQLNTMSGMVSAGSFSQVGGGDNSIATNTSNLSEDSVTPSIPAVLFAGMPKGVPPIYGPELGVSYDDISADNPVKADETIRKMAALDQSITLEGDQLTRYIKIASQMSCEYCCGVPSIITKNGEAACGCAHSFAMRGLGKYLVSKHGSEYSDEQILEEMGKWKALFFPGPISEKAVILKSQGIEQNFINLASNNYRGIKAQTTASSTSQGTGAQQVGGC